MFELSNAVAILKTRIRLLEHRKKRILAASADDSNTMYWAQADLMRIETEINEAKAQLAEREQAG